MRTPFKTILLSAFATAAVFSSAVYVSCNRDKCKTIICAHDAVCNQGVCICPTGYGGTNCETIVRDKFLGNWTVFEKGSASNAAQYHITILPGTGAITSVQIKNFYNTFETPVNGYVGGLHGDSLFINQQQLQGKFFYGIGYVNTSTTYGQFGAIYMRYQVVDVNSNKIDDFGYFPADLSEPSTWNK